MKAVEEIGMIRDCYKIRAKRKDQLLTILPSQQIFFWLQQAAFLFLSLNGSDGVLCYKNKTHENHCNRFPREHQ